MNRDGKQTHQHDPLRRPLVCFTMGQFTIKYISTLRLFNTQDLSPWGPIYHPKFLPCSNFNHWSFLPSDNFKNYILWVHSLRRIWWSDRSDQLIKSKSIFIKFLNINIFFLFFLINIFCLKLKKNIFLMIWSTDLFRWSAYQIRWSDN